MDKKLHIANSQIIFSYDRNLSVRRRLFEFEDYLKGEFKTPFRSVAIPDEIDPNIPRFESQSLNNFSKLQVSQNRIILATSYNDAYKYDFLKVKEYINNKCSLLSSLAKKENINFIAYIVELGLHMDVSQINSFLKDNTGVKAIKDGCRDFSLFYSQEHLEKFYLNIKCSKFTEKELIFHKESKTLRPTENIKYGISTLLDINTRLYFEKNKKFDESLYSKIEEETFNIINTKNIKDFLQGNI